MERAFVVMQVGAKESAERKRADETYKYVIAPAVSAAGLDPYRADLDNSPGAITPKILQELLTARVVIADLTGRNPNVFYELGITHAFARPLISLADSAESLPFDAKDERVIELGPYSDEGLRYAQGEAAKQALEESLKIVLAEDYSPPSPVREVAANRSIDQMAPDDPLASEMAQMREVLEEIRIAVKRPSRLVAIPPSVQADLAVLRGLIVRGLDGFDYADLASLRNEETSSDQDSWADLVLEKKESSPDRVTTDPWDKEPPF